MMGMSITPSDGTGTPTVMTLSKTLYQMIVYSIFFFIIMTWDEEVTMSCFHYTIPVCHLYFVTSLKAKYFFYDFCPLGQQESPWCFLLQSQTGQQLQLRLDIIPSHHFGENRKHRTDWCDPSVIWKTANAQKIRKIYTAFTKWQKLLIVC